MPARVAGATPAQAAIPIGRERGEQPATRSQRPPRRAGTGGSGMLRRVLMVACALAIFVFFAFGVVEQRWKEADLRQQVAAEEAELRIAQERNAALQQTLAATSNDAGRAAVEAAARRYLNLGYAGETIYLVNWTAPPAAPSAAPQAEPSEPSAVAPATTGSFWHDWWNALTAK